MVSKKGKMNKKLSKREREEIARSLKLVVLSDEVTSQLKLQYSERSLNRLVDLLCANKELLKEMYPCQSLLMRLNNCDVSMTKSMRSNTCKS